MAKYLHLAVPDKFTLPLCDLIVNQFKWANHSFLFISDKFPKEGINSKNVHCFSSPIRYHFFKNIKLFYSLGQSADVIYLHGAPATFFFRLFPWFTKKLAWVIIGCELSGMVKNKKTLNFSSTKFTLKRAKVHVTHIQEDSVLANKTLQCNAQFHYSPVYLSNVADTRFFSKNQKSERLKILVGNSTSPTNDHLSIFKNLKKFDEDIEKIVSPLSYGIYHDYKDFVIKEGEKLFGEKFFPIVDFYPFKEYLEILKNCDLAVFNHDRQEAMGVTLSLLSMGKVVYVNPGTTSFQSLVRRGFKIYDNNLLFQEGPKVPRDVEGNKELLEKYYTLEQLKSSLNSISINKSGKIENKSRVNHD